MYAPTATSVTAKARRNNTSGIAWAQMIPELVLRRVFAVSLVAIGVTMFFYH